MLKFITSDLRRNLTKIFCLTLGLSIGLLLVAKAFIESSHDHFIPDYEDVYIIYETVTKHGEFIEHNQTPGAIAPGMKQYAPQITDATRYTGMIGALAISTPDGRLIDAEGVTLTDSSFFDVLRQPIIAGNPKEALSVAHKCMIPRSLAEKIGGDVVGIALTSPDMGDGYTVTVGGVYEDFPVNSSFTNEIYLSMPSIKTFMHDGSENWLGNDRYKSLVRLAKGTDPAELTPHIKRMIEDKLPKEAVEIFHFNLGIKPLVGVYASQDSVKTMIWVISLLAIIILLSASLNYLLIVIGQMSRRSKEMAVRKCYGTSNAKIFGMIMGESAFFLLVSMGLAALVVLCLSDQCQMMLGFSASQLLSTGKVWIVELCVCLVLLIITGVIPAWMYCTTPISHAFSHNVSKRRFWKLALLAVQFFASGLLFCLLVLVFRQYHMMSHGDMGYEYDNLASIYVEPLPQNTRATLVSELSKLGSVEGVSSAYQHFTYGAAGNNIWIEGDPKKDNQVNVADMYYANSDLFDVMGIKLIQGETFSPTADSTMHQVIVEERFIDVLKKYFGSTDDNIVGKRFNITEHVGLDGFNEFTICGVINNIRRGGYNNDFADTRAGVLFPSTEVREFIYVRFNELTPEAIHEAQQLVNKVCGDYDLYVNPFKGYVDNLNAPVKRFGISVMVAGLAILLISIIGLIGYTADEVQRRAKEIAIRKVNGTTVRQILRLFCIDILKVAVPSLIAGGIGAMIVGRDWLSQFTEQVSLSPLSMFASLIIILIIILAVVCINSMRVARSNPVEYLRAE